MYGIRSIAAVAVVGAAALIAAASTIAGSWHYPDASSGAVASTAPSATPSASHPGLARSSRATPAAHPNTQASQTGNPGSRPTGHRPIPGGGRAGPFTLAVFMASGTIATEVAPISVGSRAVVDPPHNTARQWNTAAWVEQSTYPATPGDGTTYVYGHACHYHICPFTNLKDAQPGDVVRVSLSVGQRVYTIVRTGLSPKAASSLPPWASDSMVPNRIVLVTCAYEQGDTSTENIVVVARLTGS